MHFEGYVGRPDFWARVGPKWPKLTQTVQETWMAKRCHKLLTLGAILKNYFHKHKTCTFVSSSQDEDFFCCPQRAVMVKCLCIFFAPKTLKMPLGNVFCRREEILLPLILHSHHRVQTISDTCAPCPLIHFCQAPLGNLRDVPFMQKISLAHVTLAIGNNYLVP